jgi:TonB family protein
MGKTARGRRGAIAALVLMASCAGPTVFAQQERKAISRPAPVYPDMAKQMRLSGAVKVKVVIGTDGLIKDVQVLGGHPILVQQVEEALKKWKYAPASTETTVQLEFKFER